MVDTCHTRARSRSPSGQELALAQCCAARKLLAARGTIASLRKTWTGNTRTEKEGKHIMQSRWVIIILIVVLMAAAIIYGVWWWVDNADQIDPAVTPPAIISIGMALYALR